MMPNDVNASPRPLIASHYQSLPLAASSPTRMRGPVPHEIRNMERGLSDAFERRRMTPHSRLYVQPNTSREASSQTHAIGIFEANDFNTPDHRDRSAVMESIRPTECTNTDRLDERA